MMIQLGQNSSQVSDIRFFNSRFYVVNVKLRSKLARKANNF